MLNSAGSFESLERTKPANANATNKAKAQSYRGSGGGEGKVHIGIVLKTGVGIEWNSERRGG